MKYSCIRRLLSCMLLCCMLLCSLPAGALADTIHSITIWYENNDTCQYDNLEVNIGDTFTLKKHLTYSSSLLSKKNVTWSSSRTTVASVDSSGKVTALGAGRTVITCAADYGDASASMLITVKPKVTATKVKVTTTGATTLNDIPVGTQNYATELKVVPAGTTLTISGYTYNAWGNLWLKTSYAGKSGYLWADKAQYSGYVNDISYTGAAYPKAHYETIADVPFAGKLTTTGNIIKKIQIIVTNLDTETVALSTTSTHDSKSLNGFGTSFRDKFKALPDGWYAYQFIATFQPDYPGVTSTFTQTLVHSYFTVGYGDAGLAITKQPANAFATEGKTVKTTPKVYGEGLNYRWYWKNASQSSFNLSTCTAASYTTTMTEEKHGRQVYCVVTDQYGVSETSNIATLYLFGITKQPASTTVANGAAAKTSVTASGDGLKYQWYYTENGKSSTYKKSSITGATYSTTMNSDRAGRKVYCVITDEHGNKVTTNTVTLNMQASLKITKQPASTTVANGATAKTSVTASGDGLKYQWYYTANGKTSTFSKSSITSATYSTTMNSDRAGRKVYCVITDKSGNKVTTNTVTLNMQMPVQITKLPASTTVANGATAKTSVTASGDGLKYQWYYTANGKSSTFSKSSITSSTYSTTMNSDRAGRKVYCVITDQYGNKVTTNTVTLNMQTELKISQQPASVIVAKGKTASVTVAATGTGLKYQWYYANAGTSAFIASSQTTATYAIEMTSARDGRKLYCIITDSTGKTIKSNMVTISMK